MKETGDVPANISRLPECTRKKKVTRRFCVCSGLMNSVSA